MEEDKRSGAKNSYRVSAVQEDHAHAIVRAREHSLTLNIQKGVGEAGFNAAETLLAALGACILTNVNSLAAKMRLKIDTAQVDFYAERRDEPAELVRIDYRLILRSEEPHEKLEELHRLAVKWGTVTRTLSQGLEPKGELVVQLGNDHER